MAKLGHRIFAGSMAALFLFTAIAFSAFVVYDMSQSRKNRQTEQDTATAEAQQAQCDIRQPVDGVETIPAPEAFTTADKVEDTQVTTLAEGSGEGAKAGDCVVMKYYGTLAADGTLFDENFTEDKALQVRLGQGSVIPGWEKGLIGIKPGETRRLLIPSAQAYGENGQGSIPPNADLVFVVKLVQIKQQ